MSFVVFTASVKSAGSSSEFDPPVLVETCDDESQGESDEEINLQESNNQLLTNVLK